jgi:hypothetical protein
MTATNAVVSATTKCASIIVAQLLTPDDDIALFKSYGGIESIHVSRIRFASYRSALKPGLLVADFVAKGGDYRHLLAEARF